MPDDDPSRIRDWQRWALPSHGLKIDTIDIHCGGEPLRLVVGGFPAPGGRTMVERRTYAREHLDHLRRALVLEPRGHPRQYGALLTPPERQGSHFGVLFFHAGGYRTLSGHGIIAVATALVESGLVAMIGPETRLKLDTPAGLVRAFARVDDGRVRGVFFENVPAFVAATDVQIEVSGLGTVRYDLAFGGVFYAFVRAEEVGLRCSPERGAELREIGRRVHDAIAVSARLNHPTEAGLNVFGGVVFIDHPPRRRGAVRTADSRHACIFAEGEVNRSPGGAAISARLALEFSRGHLELGEGLVIEGISGESFVGKPVARVALGGGQALATEIEGSAFITGFNSLFIDPDDPFREGFVVS
jgi:trans-L-3-hydroxyproline dehydratase